MLWGGGVREREFVFARMGAMLPTQLMGKYVELIDGII